jgi:hypothetical protein
METADGGETGGECHGPLTGSKDRAVKSKRAETGTMKAMATAGIEEEYGCTASEWLATL